MKELDLLSAICKGIDPCDGTILDTPRDPELDKARLSYLEKLKRMEKRLRTTAAVQHSHVATKDRPVLAGKSWTKPQDEILVKSWASPARPTAKALAEQLYRSEGAIIARLVHLEQYPDRDSARLENARRTETDKQRNGETANRESQTRPPRAITQNMAIHPERIAEQCLALYPSSDANPGANYYRQAIKMGVITIAAACHRAGAACGLGDLSGLLWNPQAMEDLGQKLRQVAPESDETIAYNLFLDQFRAGDGGVDSSKLKGVFGCVMGRLPDAL